MTRPVLRPSLRSRAGRLAWIAGAWLLAAGVASLALVQAAGADGEARWVDAFVPSLLYSLSWALLTPVLLWLAWRLPLAPGGLLAALGVRVAAAAGSAFLQLNLYALLVLGSVLLRDGAGGTVGELGMFYVGRLYEGMALAGGILLLADLAERLQRQRRDELRQARLQASLAEARLAALSLELQPHFLFNALNTVSGLVYDDPEGADRMVVRLSELLRRTLAAGRMPTATVAEEGEVLELYLEIQRMRFGERLCVDRAFDPAVLDAEVPRFLLQPLVENAIKHGIAPRRDGGTVWISAAAEGGVLVLRVRDDGAGLRAGGAGRSAGTGTGLANTRSRLEHFYPGEHAFSIAPHADGGTEVVIRLPLQRTGTAAGLAAAEGA